MSIKGQQVRVHYEDFTTYIITLNRKPQPQECLTGTATVFTLGGFHHHKHRNVNQGTATASTLRGFHQLYNNFKLHTINTGMSIMGQKLRLHYEDFTTYIITLNRTPQPQECQSRDSNCVYTTSISPPI